MKNARINYVVVGGFVIAMAVGLVAAVALLTGRTGATDSYYVVYRNVAGVKFGTQVLFEGFPVGQVEEIEPMPVDDGMRFRVEVGVKEGWKVPDDSVAEITAPGLLSAFTVNIMGGKSKTALEPGSTIRGREAVNLMTVMSSVAGDFQELAESQIKPLVEDVSRAARTFTELLENEGIAAIRQANALVAEVAERTPAIFDDMEAFTADLEKVGAELALVVTPENRQRIDAIAANLERASGELAAVLSPANRAHVDAIAANLEKTSAEMTALMTPENRRRIEAMISSMDAAAEAAADLAGDLKGSQARLDKILAGVDGLVERGGPNVEKSTVALRRILDSVARHIDSINLNLDGTARNLYEFSRQIRQNPGLLLGGKPPVDEASIQ
jgi:phospholipid/cholesterol/gamma-HCH transport system substrate-binding protein